MVGVPKFSFRNSRGIFWFQPILEVLPPRWQAFQGLQTPHCAFDTLVSPDIRRRRSGARDGPSQGPAQDADQDPGHPPPADLRCRSGRGHGQDLSSGRVSPQGRVGGGGVNICLYICGIFAWVIFAATDLTPSLTTSLYPSGGRVSTALTTFSHGPSPQTVGITNGPGNGWCGGRAPDSHRRQVCRSQASSVKTQWIVGSPLPGRLFSTIPLAYFMLSVVISDRGEVEFRGSFTLRCTQFYFQPDQIKNWGSYMGSHTFAC